MTILIRIRLREFAVNLPHTLLLGITCPIWIRAASLIFKCSFWKVGKAFQSASWTQHCCITTVTFIVWKSWIMRKSIKVFTLGMSKRLFKIHAMLGLMRKFICKWLQGINSRGRLPCHLQPPTATLRFDCTNIYLFAQIYISHPNPPSKIKVLSQVPSAIGK